MNFPKDIPSDILSRADELLSAKYGTDRPIDPEIVELVCRGMMVQREFDATKAEVLAASRYEIERQRGFGPNTATPVANKYWCEEIAKAIRGTE